MRLRIKWQQRHVQPLGVARERGVADLPRQAGHRGVALAARIVDRRVRKLPAEAGRRAPSLDGEPLLERDVEAVAVVEPGVLRCRAEHLALDRAGDHLHRVLDVHGIARGQPASAVSVHSRTMSGVWQA